MVSHFKPQPIFNFASAAIILLGISAGNAESINEDLWWDRIDDAWCLRSDDRVSCLASSFDLERVTEHIMRFADRADRYQSLFAEFRFNAEEGSTPRELGVEKLNLVGVLEREGVRILEYEVDRTKVPNVQMSIFFLNFGDRYEMSLRGKNRDEVAKFANEFLENWQVSK